MGRSRKSFLFKASGMVLDTLYFVLDRLYFSALSRKEINMNLKEQALEAYRIQKEKDDLERSNNEERWLREDIKKALGDVEIIYYPETNTATVKGIPGIHFERIWRDGKRLVIQGTKSPYIKDLVSLGKAIAEYELLEEKEPVEVEYELLTHRGINTETRDFELLQVVSTEYGICWAVRYVDL